MSDVLLSRYQIIRELGSGGFGDTYLAKDLALPGHPPCVVKHLKPKDPNPSALAVAQTLFEREAEYLYRLGKHDRIPSLYAHFEETGEFYLVQEFIEGEELTQELLPGKPLSEEQTINLLREILEVLAVVHKENVIHRDIKPSNIIRRKRDKKLVLIDFGAVKEIGALTVTAAGATTMTRAIGTPAYMPSEQAQGKPRLASDVYAVGMVGIQAITGLSPDRLAEDPDTGRLLWRNQVKISDRLADILDRMTHEYYRSRYQDASKALQALMSETDFSPPLSQARTQVAYVPDVSSKPSGGLLKSLKIVSLVAIGGLATGAIAGIILLNRPLSSPPSVVFDKPAPTPTIEPTPLETPSPTPIPTQEPTPEVTISPTPTETPEAQEPDMPEPTPTVETPKTPSSTTVATVSDPSALIRDEPSLTGKILCPVRSVRTINTYGETNGWYKTDICGAIGYIHQRYLTFDRDN
jgi:serine/threonine-protein kinase